MSDQIHVRLPDGSVKSTRRGIRIADFVREEIGPGLARAAVAAKVDGKQIDLSRTLDRDASLEVITASTDEGLEVIRHSAAHIVASAVQRLYPDAQVTIGPVVEDGFYYDFYYPKGFTPEDLEKIQAEVDRIVAEDSPFERSLIPVDEAIELFKGMGEDFKVEIIEDLKAQGETHVSLYRHAGWVDLCRGPHVPSTGKVPVIRLMHVAGAYWRGDAKKPQLQRIYGTAWRTKKELEDYLHRLEEEIGRAHV